LCKGKILPEFHCNVLKNSRNQQEYAIKKGFQKILDNLSDLSDITQSQTEKTSNQIFLNPITFI